MRPLILVLFCLLCSLAGAQPYVIDSFDVKMVLDKEGVMQVEETIRATFNESRHGIYRVIPVDYDNGKGITRRMLLDHISVTDDRANSQTTKVTFEGGNVRIRIGDADTLLEPGSFKVYVIRYRCRGMMNWFEDDEGWGPAAQLYWNVTGNEWDTPITTSSCRLEFPTPADPKKLHAKIFAGPYGSRANQIVSYGKSEFGSETQTSASLGSNALTVKRDVPLDSYSGLTVVLDMPYDLIRKPTLAENIWSIVSTNLGFLMPLFVLPIMAAFWYRYGKDPSAGPIVTTFDPPEGMSGSAAGTILDERVDTRDISAGIFSLAVKGYLTLTPQEEGLIFKKRTATITLIKESVGPDLSIFEAKLLGRLRACGGTIDDTDLRTHVAPYISELRSSLYEELVDRGYYRTSPESVRVGWFIGGLVVIGAVAFLLTMITPYRQPLPAIVGGVISLIILGAFAKEMPLRTRQGSIAQAQVKGFEEFMRRARGDEMNWMAEKQPDAAMFEKYLPHAIAFGLAVEWGRRFEGIVTEPPSWYVSPYGYTGFHPMYFTRDLGTISDSIGTAAATPPRSSGGSGGSSGFGGGGFSGGGFGGGGGGSW